MEGAPFDLARLVRAHAARGRLVKLVTRARAWVGLAALVACGRAEPPATPASTAAPVATSEPAPPPPAPSPPEPAVPAEPPSAPSHASYEEALDTPESVDVDDDRVHLTDSQLRAPMNGALARCRIPRNAKVTVRTVVQYGRATGVTVDVTIVKKPKPPSKRRPSKAALRAERAALAAEAKLKAKLAACIEGAVRAQSWPPSNRRDSFVTEL